MDHAQKDVSTPPDGGEGNATPDGNNSATRTESSRRSHARLLLDARIPASRHSESISHCLPRTGSLHVRVPESGQLWRCAVLPFPEAERAILDCIEAAASTLEEKAYALIREVLQLLDKQLKVAPVSALKLVNEQLKKMFDSANRDGSAISHNGMAAAQNRTVR